MTMDPGLLVRRPLDYVLPRPSSWGSSTQLRWVCRRRSVPPEPRTAPGRFTGTARGPSNRNPSTSSCRPPCGLAALRRLRATAAARRAHRRALEAQILAVAARLALVYSVSAVMNMYFYFMQTFLGGQVPAPGVYLPMNLPWSSCRCWWFTGSGRIGPPQPIGERIAGAQKKPCALLLYGDEQVLRLLVSGRASSCGSPDRCRTASSRRTPRARDTCDNGWSTPPGLDVAARPVGGVSRRGSTPGP